MMQNSSPGNGALEEEEESRKGGRKRCLSVSFHPSLPLSLPGHFFSNASSRSFSASLPPSFPLLDASGHVLCGPLGMRLHEIGGSTQLKTRECCTYVPRALRYEPGPLYCRLACFCCCTPRSVHVIARVTAHPARLNRVERLWKLLSFFIAFPRAEITNLGEKCLVAERVCLKRLGRA